MSRVHQVASILIDIEAELRRMGCWDAQRPPPEALRSEQPFSIDTLSFAQWLQFILIPRLGFLIEQREPLPIASGIAPMAEEYFSAAGFPAARLITTLKAMDALLGSDVNDN